MPPAEDIQSGRLDWDRLLRDIKARVDCRKLARRYGADVQTKSSNYIQCRCLRADEHPKGDEDGDLQIFSDGAGCYGSCSIPSPKDEQWDCLQLYAELTGTANPGGLEGEQFKQVAFELADYVSIDLDRYTSDGQSLPSPPSRGVSAVKASTSKPPKHRQNATDKSDKFNPPDVRVEIFERIWQAVKPTDLTDAAIRYLEDRNITPDVAHAYGCRDWYAARSDINGVIGDYDIGELKKAGLCKGDGNPSKMLKAVNGSNWHQGLAFPLWHPEYPNAPVAVRWRHYNGTKRPSQPSSHLAFEAPPLGLLEPSPQNQSLVNESYCDAMIISGNLSGEKHHREWWNDKTPRNIGNYPGNYAVVFCEGETDWLSVASAAAELETSMRIVPVGVTSMSSSWPERWTPEIEGADLWIAGFDGDNSDPDCTARERADEIRKELIKRHPKGRGGINHRYIYGLRPEHGDLNDLRQDGKLTTYIRAKLPEETPNE